MSANNVVWVMNHIHFNGLWHVFYSGCMDNTPEKPDYKDKYYKVFNTKSEAIMYAHDVVEKIDEFSLQEGHVGVEYGVCIVPYKDKDKPKARKDGCYQFTYCNECMAYPMGLGCPNIVKGPVQLKDEVKHGNKD